MGQPLKYEDGSTIFFITSRTIGARIWFNMRAQLDYDIVAYLAKCQKRYSAIIYAFCIQGNHYHLIARFPGMNKSSFMRDFNSMIAKLVKKHQERFTDGKLWARRYADQVFKRDQDVEQWFFYTALNPVHAGLSKDPKIHPGYNSFDDAVNAIDRIYTVTNWSLYQDKVRYNPSLKKEDFDEEFTLHYTRLPGFEEMSASEYASHMLSKMKVMNQEAIDERLDRDLGFMPPEQLKSIKPGSTPRNVKVSERYSLRPLILTSCQQTRSDYLKWYFGLQDEYTISSNLYRKGEDSVKFPKGTYKPPKLC